MLTVHLLRHGQTAWNVERRFLGRTDVDLDDVGVAQVAGLRGVFPAVGAVYASPLQRALRTAQAVGAPLAVPGLVEMDMGVLEGLSGPDALAKHGELLLQFRADPAAVVIPGGETMAQVADRMLGCWRSIVAGAGDAPIAVVSHQMAMAALLCRLTGSPLSDYKHFTQRNTAWTTLAVDPAAASEPGGVRVVAKDQAPHLSTG